MQALYMIFWKTDSQLTQILADTEPFSLSQVLHTSYTLVLLQHRRVSMAGTAWPATWLQREHGAQHLQEMGRGKFTHPGREPSVITAGSSFPSLRGRDRFSLACVLNHRTWRVPLLWLNPATGTMPCNLSSAGTATSACPPHSNHKQSAIHAGTNQYWRYQLSWSWQKMLKASETLPWGREEQANKGATWRMPL